jgi:TctA family transporter
LFFYIPLVIYSSSDYGIDGVSWGLVFMMSTLIIPNWYFLVNKLCYANFIEYHIQIIQPLVIATISGIIAFLVIEMFRTNIILLDIIIVSLVGFVSIVLLNLKYNKEFISTFGSLIKRNG